MIYKKNYKFSFIFLWIALAWTPCYAKTERTVQEISQTYQKSLDMFSQLTKKDSNEQALAMHDLFLQLAVPSEVVLKNLRQDVRFLAKEMKRLKKTMQATGVVQNLHQQLSDLIKYIKKHRLQYDIIMFHKDVYHRWGVLFKAITDGNDKDQLLELVDKTQQNADGFKVLLKKIAKDQLKVDEYEYRLHSDWIDMKLANYVLKIELIRARNAVLFHPLYKGTKLQLPSNYPR